LFQTAGKGAWLSSDDQGFRTLRPEGIDGLGHRAEILAGLGDYSEMAIYLVQRHIKPTSYLTDIDPDLDAIKLLFESEWSAVDNKRWCGDGCWMVWCEIKPDEKPKNIGPIAGYWEVDVTTKRITVVDGTATPKFFTTAN
jgi:hypothetical protein